MELLSVIVPVYNAEQYLEKTVESILTQSYQNIEVILVDDGSTDNSAEVCKMLCEKDKRVIYIYKENEGACFARRDGLCQAGGKYVTFVDSDDLVEKDAYEKVFERMIEEGADIATFAFRMNNESVVSKDLAVPGIYTGRRKEELCATMIYDEKAYRCGILCSLWTKIYRKDLILKAMKMAAPNLQLWEDLNYMYLPFVWADKVLITDVPGYIYVERANSVSHKIDKKELEKTIYSFEQAKNNYLICDVRIQDSLKFMYARALRDIMCRTCEDIELHKDTKTYAMKKLSEMADSKEACAVIREALVKQKYMPSKDRKMLKLLVAGNIDGVYRYYWSLTFPRRVKKFIGRKIRRILGWK